MKCKICNSDSYLFDTFKIQKKYNGKYFKCIACNFVQIENHYWLEEAYKIPIDIYDTGILQRNIVFSEKTAIIIFF